MASQYENSAVASIRSVFNIVPQGPNQYDVGLPLPLGTLFVRIKFQNNFPNTAPTILVAALVAHPLIVNENVIDYPERKVWNAKISVVSVLQNIHRSFSANPPKPLQISSENPNFVEILKNWNKPIEDESDILEFIYSLEEIKKLVDERDILLQKNIEKVNESLKKREDYLALISEHKEETDQIENLTIQLGEMMKQVENVQKIYSSEMVVEKLKEKEANYYKQASHISKKFLRKEMGLEEFISEYQNPIKRLKFIQLSREGR